MKYGKKASDLKQYILDAPVFTAAEAKEERIKKRPIMSLLEASQPNNIGKVVQSNIQVVATFEKAMPVPTVIIGKKVNATGADKFNTMDVNTTKTWQLTEHNCQDILYLMDNNFNESQIVQNIRLLLGIPKNEHDIHVDK